MNLSAPISRPEVATPVALLLGNSRATAEHLRLEVWPRLAQDPKGKGALTDAASVSGATPKLDASLGRVLVVDDDALVRRTLSLSLTRAGFAATAVESAEAALDLLRAGEAFDLLVTDQSMPGMTGCELIGEAARLRPGLPALLVTGYDLAGGLEQLPEHVPILRKPAERAAFVGQVRALLGVGEEEPEAGAGA
jgi:CheY-like chemotaxis protein